MLKKLLGAFRGRKAAESDAAAEARNVTNRAGRVQLEGLHEVSFKLHGDLIQLLPLANLSASGMAFLRQGARIDTTKGASLQGELKIQDKAFEVTAKVAHVSDTLVGCAFVGDVAELMKTIEEYFKAELSALRMTEVNPEILKEEDDGRPRMFRGQNNCELFFVENAGKVVRFQLSIFGAYIEGGAGKPTKYGFLAGAGSENAMARGGAFVKIVPELTPDVLALASKFLGCMPSLSDELRAQIRAAFAK